MTALQQQIHVQGPGGRLGATLWPVHTPRAEVVILHPDTSRGGDRHHPLVQSLGNAAARIGVQALALDLRGTAGSGGRYDRGIGEVDDLAAAVEQWVTRPMLLAGYSFGAFVALSALAQSRLARPCAGLLLVAPPIGLLPMPAPPPGIPGIILHGSEDGVVSIAAVTSWQQQYCPDWCIWQVEAADHFFAGYSGVIKSLAGAAFIELCDIAFPPGTG